MQHIFRTVKRSHRAQKQRFKRWRKHPLALAITVAAGLLVAGAGAYGVLGQHKTEFKTNNSFIVVISRDNQKQTVPTNEPTVGKLLQRLNIPLGNGDRVEPSLDTPIVQDNLRVNIYRAVPVTIVDGSTVTTALSAGATPRSIVSGTGMTLYAEDRVTMAPATDLAAQSSLGQQVTIDRSVPVTMNIYGTILPLRTHTSTVAELLKAKNVKLTKADSVIPAENTPVTPNMQVFVVRKGTQIVTATQDIPAPVQVVTDSSLSFGTSAIRQQGSPGKQVLTYQVNTQNGVEVSRTLLQSVITVQPVTQIVAHGLAVSIPADKQAVMAQAGISSSDYAYVDYIMSHEGGWCPTKVQGQYGSCPGFPPAVIPANLGYGIGQATPGNKMAAFGADWETNVVTQLRWASSYASRYGGWAGAYNHWVANHNW